MISFRGSFYCLFSEFTVCFIRPMVSSTNNSTAFYLSFLEDRLNFWVISFLISIMKSAYDLTNPHCNQTLHELSTCILWPQSCFFPVNHRPVCIHEVYCAFSFWRPYPKRNLIFDFCNLVWIVIRIVFNASCTVFVRCSSLLKPLVFNIQKKCLFFSSYWYFCVNFVVLEHFFITSLDSISQILR